MMNPACRRAVSCGLIVTALSAAGIVAHESLPGDRAAKKREEFQSLTGGLGLGSSVNLSQCSFSFDPRLQPACSHVDGPIPAGFFLCTGHMGCASGYPNLPPASNMPADTDDHATSR